ncbi:MAG: Cof-type HAD-IIB family hydrolase [Puia sp.]|nr:Cof-type HAD-IIB family hydrolase [Puia sp.]
MYKAVFLDMDGTLLKSDHTISEATKRTISRLTHQGIPVILVSARPLDAILPYVRDLGTAHYPVVSLNGGYIVLGEEPIFQAVIDAETTAGLVRELKQFSNTTAYYLRREWFAEVDDEWVKHEQRISDVRVRIQPIEGLVEDWAGRGTGPNKLMVMSDPPSIGLIQGHLKSIYGDGLNIYPSKPTYLEIMNPEGSKSNAVRFLIGRMGLDRSEIIAMGDNYNDKEMIRFAGMGVAMGNAPDEIKQAADYVTETNNEDGVRKALEKLIPGEG